MLAPNPSLSINQLTDLFNANNSITSWVQALENAVIAPITPQPSWYTPLTSALEASQTNSKTWISTTSRLIHAQVSQSFIDYANLFFSFAPAISNLVAQIKATGNIPSAAQQLELTQLVAPLLKQANAGLDVTSGLMADVVAYQAQMNSDQQTLLTALNAALGEQEADREAIQQVQLQIAQVLQEIAVLSSKANSSTIRTGTGMVTVVVGMTFGLAIAGGVLALGGFAGAVIGIGAAAVFAEIDSQEVQADYVQLQKLMGQLADDQMQLAMVNGAISNLQNLLLSNDAALRTFASFVDVWSWVVYGLSSMQVVLAQPQIDVTKIPDLNDLQDAVSAWQQLATYAQEVQNSILTIAPPIAFPQALINPGLTLVAREGSAA